MDCGSRGSVERDRGNVVDSMSDSSLDDGGGGFLNKSQGDLDGCSSETNTSLLQTGEQKGGGEDEFLLEDAFEIMLPSLTSIMHPESMPSCLDEDKPIIDMGICDSPVGVVDSPDEKYKYEEAVPNTKETAISCEVSTLLSCDDISDLSNATAESVACFKMAENPRPVVSGCSLPSESTALTSLPCSSPQENKLKNMKSINDEASIVESEACRHVSSTSSAGIPLQSLCTGGSVSSNSNSENCKDEQSLRVLESSRSMDESTGGDMYIQVPTAGDCVETLDKFDISGSLNRVGLCGAQTDNAIVQNLYTCSNAGRLEDISDVTTDVKGGNCKNMLHAEGNVYSSKTDCTELILNCADEKSISQTCMALGIVRDVSSQSLEIQEQLKKNCFGPISCNSAVDCRGQSDDAGKELAGAGCISENDCLTALSSSLQRRCRTRKSSRKARGTACRKKAVKMPCLDETVGFLFKASRRKRSCLSKPARSTTWGLSSDIMLSAQKFNPGDTGVQNQAVGSQESGRRIKESANKSQRGSSKKSQVSSGSLRFKIKVGKDVGQTILNTVANEKVDASASADILSSNYRTGMKEVVSKFPKSASDTKKDLHKQMSDHQSKLKEDFVKEDSCPVACCVDPELENNDVIDIQEETAEDAVLCVPRNRQVEVEASGGANNNRYMGPETSPDSEVINSVPDVLSRHQELQSAVLIASDSPGGVKSSRNSNSIKKDNSKFDGAVRSRKLKSSKNRRGKKKSNDGFHSAEILPPPSIPDFSGSAGGKIPSNLLSESAFTEGILHLSEEDKIVVAEGHVQLGYGEDGNESCSPNCLRSLDSKMSRPSKNKQHWLPKSSRPCSVNKGRSKVSDSAFIGEGFACRKRGPQQMQESGLIAHEDHKVEDDVMNMSTGSKIASVDMPVLDPGSDGTGEQSTLPDSAWVLCDDCHKWRRISVALANSMDEACSWTCKDNLDAAFADCSVPQEKSNEDINAELGISDGEEEGHNGELNYEVQEKQSGYRCRKAPQSHFWHIDSNKFLHRSRKSQTIDEIMVCHCKHPPEGQLGCGDSCLNRMLNIECIQGTCPCGDLCSNQLFQKRSYANMEWARCGRKGFGLKMFEDISAGKFLIEYVGEVLDMQAYEARQNDYASMGQRHFYFMTLNANEIIDACEKGNLGRFINHSCDPNCRTEKWMVNGEICIGLFALRDIKKGEELTFDYNYVRVFGAAAKKCHCGAAQCRGYIGGDPLSAEVIVQDDSDEEYPEPVMLKDGQDLDSLTMASSRLDLVNDTKMPSFETVTKGAEENEISDVVVGQTESPKEPESSVETEYLRTNFQSPRETAAAHLVDTAKEEKATDKLGHSLAKPEMSSSVDKADKEVKLEIKGRKHAISKSRPRMKTPSSIPAKKGKVCAVPPSVNKTQIVATKAQPFSIKSKKSLESSSCGRFETVEEKLNELLDSDGGITKRKDTPKVYLKLLLLTAASGDSGNGEAIQRNRELSMILDALLKTKSRAVLTDIINKNGLQMLHNIMKKYRRDFIKIPILRKLLKVLVYLAMREILTPGHITASPPCRGMESFRESILSLTEHGDKQVHQIARSFRERWIPRQYKKSIYIERDEGRLEFNRTVDPNRYELGVRPAGAVDCAKQVRSTPSPNPANWECCSTSSVGVSGTTATRIRKRKSRWDVPGEPDNELKIGSGAAKKLESSPLPELVACAHNVDGGADKSLNSAWNPSQHPGAINPGHGKQSTDDEDVPPGFSLLATSSISTTSSAAARQPSEVVVAHPQKRFKSRLPVSYGIPLETVQQLGSHAADSRDRWVVAPSMPFHPFPPLPPHPRSRKDGMGTSSASNRNDQAADSHTPESCCTKERPNLEMPDPDTILGKRMRQDSHAMTRKYFRQQKRKGPPWPKDEFIEKNRVGIGSANDGVSSSYFLNDSNCRMGKAQNGFHDLSPHRSRD